MVTTRFTRRDTEKLEARLGQKTGQAICSPGLLSPCNNPLAPMYPRQVVFYTLTVILVAAFILCVFVGRQAGGASHALPATCGDGGRHGNLLCSPPCCQASSLYLADIMQGIASRQAAFPG